MEIQGVLYVDPSGGKACGVLRNLRRRGLLAGALVLPVRKEGEECTCGN